MPSWPTGSTRSPGYPFLVDLRAAYQLGADGLAVTFTLTNRGDSPAPIGVGAHPYVRLGPGAIDRLELHVPVRSSYVTDDRGIPTARRCRGRHAP